MAPADLNDDIDAWKADLAAFNALHDSPGYILAVGKFQALQTDLGLMEVLANAFKTTPDGLAAICKAANDGLKLGDSLAAKANDYIALLTKIKGHPYLVDLVAKLLG